MADTPTAPGDVDSDVQDREEDPKGVSADAIPSCVAPQAILGTVLNPFPGEQQPLHGSRFLIVCYSARPSVTVPVGDFT